MKTINNKAELIMAHFGESCPRNIDPSLPVDWVAGMRDLTNNQFDLFFWVWDCATNKPVNMQSTYDTWMEERSLKWFRAYQEKSTVLDALLNEVDFLAENVEHAENYYNLNGLVNDTFHRLRNLKDYEAKFNGE